MTDELIDETIEEIIPVVESVVENKIASMTEEEARHAAYQAQIAAENARQVAEQLQTQAIIQAANIEQEAAKKIAEHENNTLNLQDEVQWLKSQIQEMQQQIVNLMESHLLTRTTSQESQTLEVPTVTPQQNVDGVDLAAQEVEQETETIAEIVNEILPKRKIKIL